MSSRAPVKGVPARLTRAMRVDAAFDAVVRASLAHLRANERGMLRGSDPEYLHQMRVALRRLRSAFSVFRPAVPATPAAPVVAELKWLASSLGPARDWDVLHTGTLPLIARKFGPRGDLEALGESCGERRRQAGEMARRAVRSARYRRLVLFLPAWLESWSRRAELDALQRAALAEPLGGFAARMLDRRYDRVRKRVRHIRELSGRQLHRLRIAVKKFRYSSDFFAGLYAGRPVRTALRRLSDLQDILGSINDAATAVALIGLGFGGVENGEATGARGLVLGWCRDEAARRRRRLAGAWKAFRSARRFWR